MRSHEFEAEFLARVAGNADPESASRFVSAVRERLAKGAEEYGDLAFLDRTFPEIIREMAEEGTDGPGWGLFAAYLVGAGELEQLDREHLEKMLVAASVKFFEAWQVVQLAAEFYEERAG